jgi:hypothetical protein
MIFWEEQPINAGYAGRFRAEVITQTVAWIWKTQGTGRDVARLSEGRPPSPFGLPEATPRHATGPGQ